MTWISVVLLSLLFTSLPSAALSQTKIDAVERAADLPDAPGESVGWQAGNEETGSITGTVFDINGGIVPDARVSLREKDLPGERIAISDASGRFAFTGLKAGRYTFQIMASGLETFVSAEILLRTGERREAPQVSLPVASATADVQVTVTQEELAQEQVQAEEKQRVLGVLPNFYTSYIWNAAPLTKKQKYNLAVHSALDPTEFIGAAVQAATEQWANTFGGYGDDAAGYGKRFAASYGDGAIARMIGSAVLPSLLHQDPRYFYRGSGTKKSRAFYAIKMAVLARGDNGKLQPAYSYIGGAFASGGISNAYHPHADRGAGLVVANGFIDIAGHAVQNLIREFVTRGVTKGVPDYEKGKINVDTTPTAAKKSN